jgi:hypothetical protein
MSETGSQFSFTRAVSIPTRKQLSAVICLTLVLVTAALYWPMTHHQCINVDDEQYITGNPHVRAGLTWSGIVWAFESQEASNWHPLTWISHMLDCRFFGLNPGGHHLTNLLFHAANPLLLFLLLRQLTGVLWRSAFVAALFAWHPLHVESVAWAAERKDVLSAFFWILALMAYARYARRVTSGMCAGTQADPASSPVTRHPSLHYFLALLFFACGLMSKPMVVTLPFVLLLLDFWPLNRLQFQSSGRAVASLVFEKLPFFALALAGSVVTYLIQKAGGAVWSVAALPLHARVANALLAYVRYLAKTFWPADLAIIYPHPRHWPVMAVIGAALMLAIWSVLFLRRARQNPYLPAGWFWFLGTFIPAIGLVQVGSQSMADRYTYLPGIGLFILIVWGLNDFSNHQPQGRKMAILIGSLALAGCLACTGIQLTYWQSSITLLRHAIEVTKDNFVAWNFLGRALDDAGNKDGALLRYAESVRLESRYPQAQYNLGMAWLNRGRAEKACEPLAAAVRLVPDDAEARYYFGLALMDNKPAGAVEHYRQALRLTPEFPEAKAALNEILSTNLN